MSILSIIPIALISLTANKLPMPSNSPSVIKKRIVIGIVQPPLRPESMTPLASAQLAEKLMRSSSCSSSSQKGATEESVDLFVLPELSPIGYSQATFDTYLKPILSSDAADNSDSLEELQKIQCEIEELFAQVAIELNCYICYGAVGVITNKSKFPKKSDEENQNNSQPGNKHIQFTIQQKVIGPSGEDVAYYDKIHLCNYGDCSESKYFTAGSMKNLSSFNCRGFEVGLSICADIRNPILYHRLVSKHEADVLLQPAAFSRDVSFPTWKSFRVTRAVENSAYFVGVNYSGENYGESSLVGPWVDESDQWKPIVMGTEEGVLTKPITREALDHVRRTMPFHQRVMTEIW